ncbi:aromatic amino acid hydroxylase [Parapedobacter koreensis]|uniref:Phenylalanine-4-hydroxylase n=1 Tax=Parapedobacter koreensis TaxID=332977 RepID=A0A1H7MAW0_9SPHI|nr:aromatic amino acid hydroxylase [Parapedobacter koreensis]SEL08261.1 phenylalanine-4-hydroxylase [Parapedobacter koreensis]
MKTYGNPVLEQLPLHLQQYIVDQQYERYTPVDQAVWRYVMRQNHAYLKDVAYYPYIPGLKKAGLSIERIPDLQTMNDSLRQLGWGAATVDGFIPPAAFMEFQAHRVLVIAADIRQAEHIAYTPAPDIIHESAGHAPIIAEPAYAAYLRYFGEIGTKAMFSYRDFELYEAIRHLSIVKEQHGASKRDIEAAEWRLQEIQGDMGEPSEMALLSRLHWWTVEYGLIGTIDQPKIYGAGLLSSIGESAACMRADVPKLPYSLDAVHYPYDITKPQPQLFVTPDFQRLLDVLEAFADTMAFRMGGVEGLAKAVECRNVCTVEYSAGLQVSGVFVPYGNGRVRYVKTAGPTALAYGGRQLQGHSKEYHANGFGSPIGRLLGSSRPLEAYDDVTLATVGITVGRHADLLFESGIHVEGTVVSILRKDGNLLLISFNDCRVTDERDGTVLFKPDWGTYDMAVGTGIASVWCGAADKDAFEQAALVAKEHAEPPVFGPRQLRLHEIYASIREIREYRRGDEERLTRLYEELAEAYPEDWLASLELLELAHQRGYSSLAGGIATRLLAKSRNNPELEKLVADGLRLVANPAKDWLMPQ